MSTTRRDALKAIAAAALAPLVSVAPAFGGVPAAAPQTVDVIQRGTFFCRFNGWEHAKQIINAMRRDDVTIVWSAACNADGEFDPEVCMMITLRDRIPDVDVVPPLPDDIRAT